MANKKVKNKKKNQKKMDLGNPIIIGAALEPLVQLYGEAASQIVQAYNGVRVDSKGRDLNYQGKSLKEISQSKVNKDYVDANLRQQSGFAAEQVHEARSNKKAILKGKKTRLRTTDGLGKTNHPKYDHVTVDEKNQPIKGTGQQMKFLTSEVNKPNFEGFDVIEKIVRNKKWEKYDGDILIPKGEAKKARIYAQKKADSLRKQAERLKRDGKTELAAEKERLAQRYAEAGKRVKDSELTHKEAMEARKSPEKFVVKEVLSDSHVAGKEAAKGAMGAAALVSAVSNSIAIERGDKDYEEALKDLGKDIAVSGASAYLVGASGSALKAVMHASRNQFIRDSSGFAGQIVGAGIAIASSLKRYAEGTIDGVGLVEELGERGVASLFTGYMAVVGAGTGELVGSVLLPGPGTAIGGFIGGYVGGMIGHTFSSFVYHGILNTLANEKIAHERRQYLEELSEGMLRANTLYQIEIQEFAERDASTRRVQMQDIFVKLDNSIYEDNLVGYTQAVNDIGKYFGADLHYKTPEEFYDFMDRTEPGVPLVI